MYDLTFEQALYKAGYTAYDALCYAFPNEKLAAELANYMSTDALLEFVECCFENLDIDPSEIC